MTHKDETFHVFLKFYRKVTNEKDFSCQNIRSDHRIKFKNQDFKKFYDEKDIDHNFSVPRTSQQNGIVEKKNRTLEEMACTILSESNLPRYFWTKEINTVCYILNHALIRPILRKSLISFGKKENQILYIFIFLVVDVLY